MKRPSFQFYPGDWQHDAALRSCSVAARGLWIEIMCIMHQADPYGYMVLNGKQIDSAQLGRMTGATAREIDRWIAELEDSGVCSRDETGLFSRRMVRDEEIRAARAEGGNEGAEHGNKGGKFGVLGGRPKKERGVIKPPLYPPPSSSSSSSSSVNPKTKESTATAIGDSEAPPPLSSSQIRAETIANRLNKFEAGRGKARTFNAADARVLAWAESGVKDSIIKDAYDMALTRRIDDADETPINAGFLDLFIVKLMAPAFGRKAALSLVPGWHETAPGIEAKGAELGVDPPSPETGGFPAFKARVFAAAGNVEEAERIAL